MADGSCNPAMTEEDLLEAWHEHKVESIKEFYAPEYEGVDVAQAEPQRGPQGLSQTVERYLQAFPDLRFLEEETVVQDNRVVLIWTARGTHKGKLMHIPPTGKISVCGVSSLTVKDGRITRGGCTSGT